MQGRGVFHKKILKVFFFGLLRYSHDGKMKILDLRNTASMSDKELLGLFRESGDMEVLGLVYNRYIHLVYGMCLKYMKSREDAQDLVMEIFEDLSMKLRGQEVEYFKSWLYVVTRNSCLMALRKANKTATFPDDLMENEISLHPNVDRLPEDDLDSLNACIEELKSGQLECVRKFYLDRKSYQEVSELTGFSTKEVKSYIQNGKRNLKACIEKKRRERGA